MKWCFVSKTFPSKQKKVETSSMPLLEVTCEGMPYLEKTWRTKNSVSLGEVMVSTVEMKRLLSESVNNNQYGVADRSNFSISLWILNSIVFQGFGVV